MIIELKKFGTTLISRQTGREAFSALQAILRDVKKSENIEIDFDGVLTFSPSWGAEFLMPLLIQILCRSTHNANKLIHSVAA